MGLDDGQGQLLGNRQEMDGRAEKNRRTRTTGASEREDTMMARNEKPAPGHMRAWDRRSSGDQAF